MSYKLDYRKDIDGLRAIAVISVLLYHLGAGVFEGGFIGVDLFFVISGYLVGGIVISEILQNKFSLIKFYARRVKRIYPALMIMLIITCIIFNFFTYPAHFKTILSSAIAAMASVSNILFWNQAGYFDAEATVKPLLHTWTLGVEWSFYLLLPIMLLAINKIMRGGNLGYLLSISVFFILSLCLSINMTLNAPETAFYLLPYRAWEFLLGTLVFLLPSKNISQSLQNIFSIAGLLLIVYAIVCFDSKTNFPGANALIPCIGVAMIIYAGDSHINNILKLKFLVFTGVISYSLYLWHFPVIIATRALYAGAGDGRIHYSVRLVIIGVSFVIAALSHKFIENPFRKAVLFNSGRYLAKTVLVILICMAPCAAIIINDGQIPYYPVNDPQRSPMGWFGGGWWDYNQLDDPASLAQIVYDKKYVMGDISVTPNTILWGDSHALSVSYGMDEVAKSVNKSFLLYSYSGTWPVLGYSSNGDSRKNAIEFNDKVFEIIKSNSEIKNVFLVGNWRASLAADARDKLENTIIELNRLNKNIYFFMDFPRIMNNIYFRVKRVHLSEDGYNAEYKELTEFLTKLKQSCQFTVVNYQHGLLENGRYLYEKDENFLYADSGHLNVVGSCYVAEKNKEFLLSVFNAASRSND